MIHGNRKANERNDSTNRAERYTHRGLVIVNFVNTVAIRCLYNHHEIYDPHTICNISVHKFSLIRPPLLSLTSRKCDVHRGCVLQSYFCCMSFRLVSIISGDVVMSGKLRILLSCSLEISCSNTPCRVYMNSLTSQWMEVFYWYVDCEAHVDVEYLFSRCKWMLCNGMSTHVLIWMQKWSVSNAGTNCFFVSPIVQLSIFAVFTNQLWKRPLTDVSDETWWRWQCGDVQFANVLIMKCFKSDAR